MRVGYIAIVGRPNVGKSTLLNRILGRKVSITSHKPQTTRHRILGIKTTPTAQFIYCDTPGLHRGGRRAMNRYMNRAARSVLEDVDVVLFVVEALHWRDEDEYVLEQLGRLKVPVVLAVNKVDRLQDKARLLPFLKELADRHEFAEVIPVSATRGTQIAALEEALERLLPEGAPYFEEDRVTDRGRQFMTAEFIREKLMRRLHQELPYATAVTVDRLEREPGLTRVEATIWVERPSQKGIVIGRGGEQLRQIGRDARLELERFYGDRVYLQLWVKVREGWSDDERLLRSLGYADED